ncbi:uncharacterized protein LOC141673945 [Apium graveolens]|uniref:uncharacterized protein LOC141673945 n=1 Tax=Apium graveolens TaxID=4045 RepID=UPI003D7BB949
MSDSVALSVKSHDHQVNNTWQFVNKTGRQSNIKKSASDNSVICEFYQMSGHTKDKYFCVHGYPPWHRLHGKPKPRPKSQIRTSHAYNVSTNTFDVVQTPKVAEATCFTSAQCYATNTLPHKDKFSNRAIRCIFLGYPFAQKAYKIMNLATRKVFVSRDPEDPFYTDILVPSPTVSLHDILVPPIVQPTTFPSASHMVDIAPVDLVPVISTRQSTRLKYVPNKFQDFVCLPSTLAPKVNNFYVLSPTTNFTSQYQAFIANITHVSEPTLYKIACQHDVWCAAMTTELAAHEANNTWQRYKARLVARGFTQIEGLDYFETFAHVAKMSTVRVLLSLAVVHNWSVTQMDVTNVFLYGDLHEEVYMSIPQGYCLPVEFATYDVKVPLSDHSLFILATSACFIVVLVYVDDILVVGNVQSAIATFKLHLDGHFKIKDLVIRP